MAISAALLLGLSACATRPSDDDLAGLAAFEEANDPWEPTNRAIFDFNLFVDKAVLQPVARAYNTLLLPEIRDAISGVLANAKEPLNFFNALLQGSFERAGTALGRVAINTTFGLAGMFDVAKSELGLEPVKEDFGQTLAVWGSGEGPYIVLPLFGPSNVRDSVGFGVDTFANPLRYVFDAYDVEYISYAMAAVDGIDVRARNLAVLDEIERTSIDFYATLRSLYRQRRNRLISNGELDDKDDPLDDPFADPFSDPFGEPLAYSSEQ